MTALRRPLRSIDLFFPLQDESFDILAELALDLRWSWDHGADDVWERLNPDLWESTRNPWIVLQTVSRDRLEEFLSDPDFREELHALLDRQREASSSPGWFQDAHPDSPLTSVAYFSMEFMLSEALPIYSGGLGNVAGDLLKASSDLGVPVVGVGLLYQQGYFRQAIDDRGRQQALYPYNDPGQLPIAPLRGDDGEWLQVEVALPDGAVRFRAWKVTVGQVNLLLLDSNHAENLPVHRGITSELYGGGPELRLKQEMALGIGGWRLLSALDVRPEVCHLNEGHAALAVLERAREEMERGQCSFQDALVRTRAGNLFTTHTPVAAGFDQFPPSMVQRYLGRYAAEELGLSLDELLALGRVHPKEGEESFNMAYLAIRGSGAVNAVSELHANVSRRLFQPLFPRWPTEEVPVDSVTNGIHVPTWDSEVADRVWTAQCGKDRWRGTTEALEEDIRALPDEKIWRMRNEARASLVDAVRERLERQWRSLGAPREDLDQIRRMFDPDVLTVGFARRFAEYKRPTLLLHDPDRFRAILGHEERPVQIFVAGKAHPADEAGLSMITEWVRFVRDPRARDRAAFLPDHDMLLTETLVRGVDLWINTPRRPWEACGTSGMKVLVNGGLNLSELDGWWAEAYGPDVGWALGDGRDHGRDPDWDAREAAALYDLLESEIIPAFYSRNEEGIPEDWVARMRESMARLTPRFSANRMLRQYTERHYLPAAEEFRSRSVAFASGRGEETGETVPRWLRRVNGAWSGVRIGEVRVERAGDDYLFTAEVDTGDLDPASVRVEVFADPSNGGEPVRWEMTPVSGPEAGGNHRLVARVPASRPESDFTVRAIPTHEGVAVPLEIPAILWQR